MNKLRYGVFLVDNSWRLYCETGRSVRFADRPDAERAGLRAARQALSDGYEVELFVQEAGGELRQADLEGLIRTSLKRREVVAAAN